MDVEKTIAFLLEHEARTAVRLDQITEKLDQITARAGAAERRMDRWERTMRVYVRLGAGRIARVERNAEIIQEQLRSLTERVHEVTEKLDGLVDLVDRHVREPGLHNR